MGVENSPHQRKRKEATAKSRKGKKSKPTTKNESQQTQIKGIPTIKTCVWEGLEKGKEGENYPTVGLGGKDRLVYWTTRKMEGKSR